MSIFPINPNESTNVIACIKLIFFLKGRTFTAFFRLKRNEINLQ